MIKIFNRRPLFFSSVMRRNYTELSDFNHYRDARLHDKYFKDVFNNKYHGMKMNNEINDTITNSILYTYKDYRNYLLQEKYIKNKK